MNSTQTYDVAVIGGGAAGRADVSGYGVELIDGRVEAIETGFVVRLADGRTPPARRILVTAGATDQLPDIPGVRERHHQHVEIAFSLAWQRSSQVLKS